MQFGVRHLGDQQAYEPVWQAMKRFTDDRTDDTQDEIWLLQHAPVFTQGQAGKPEHLLFTGDIPVVQTDRGGQVTYHGPGQWVAYIMVDLQRLGLGPRTLVDAIENCLVDLLATYGIEAHPREGAPGVYVGEAKIASLGLRIRKGQSFHGLALNVDMDLEPFRRINPCGHAGMAMTSMADLLPAVDMNEVGEKLLDHLKNSLKFDHALDLGNQLP